MVQVFQGLPDLRTQGLGKALGEGLSSAIGQYYTNKGIEDVINNPELKDKPLTEKWDALMSGLSRYGEKGQRTLINIMQGEQLKKQEKEKELDLKKGEILAKRLQGIELTPQEKKVAFTPEEELDIQKVIDAGKKYQSSENAAKSVKSALIKSGYPEETADLWEQQMKNAPIGGQSDVIKNVNDLIRRSKTGKGLGTEEEGKEELKPSIEIPGMDLGKLELDFPELNEPVGLTPKDVVDQNKNRENVNFPLYEKTVKHLNALDEEYRDIELLQDLNHSENIPTGINWNVDWNSGDLRFKSLATTETQEYVKTIARMARRAKDYFPGRVTNFDLEQFKEGFATLANTKEGREIINKQLAISNRIAYLEEETFKAAVDHYGSGADPHLIRKYAQQNYKRLKSQLENQLKGVNKQAFQMTGGVEKQPNLEKPKVPVEKATSLEDLFG